MTDIRCHKRNEINATCEIRKYRSVYCNKFYEIIMRYEKDWPIFTTKKDNQFWEYFTYFQVKYIKNPVFDIYFNNTLSLFIRVCSWCLHTDHGLYKKWDSSVKNVTLSNFVNGLTAYCMCDKLKNESIFTTETTI